MMQHTHSVPLSPSRTTAVRFHHNLLRLPALACQSTHEGRCEVLSCKKRVMQHDTQLWKVIWAECHTALQHLAQDAGLRIDVMSITGQEWRCEAGGV